MMESQIETMRGNLAALMNQSKKQRKEKKEKKKRKQNKKAERRNRERTFLLKTRFRSLIYVMSPSSSLARFLENLFRLSCLSRSESQYTNLDSIQRIKRISPSE